MSKCNMHSPWPLTGVERVSPSYITLNSPQFHLRIYFYFMHFKVNNKNLIPILTSFSGLLGILSVTSPLCMYPPFHSSHPLYYPWRMSLGFKSDKSVVCLVIGASVFQINPE